MPLFGLGRSCFFGRFWAFFAFLRPDDVTGCDAMGECEWTECEAGWRFFCGSSDRIDTEIVSGSVTSLELFWRGNLPQPQVIKTPRGSLPHWTARSSRGVDSLKARLSVV